MAEKRIKAGTCCIHDSLGHARISGEKAGYYPLAFSNEKIGDYYIGAHRVITNLFGCREFQAYVTATEKEHGK